MVSSKRKIKLDRITPRRAGDAYCPFCGARSHVYKRGVSESEWILTEGCSHAVEVFGDYVKFQSLYRKIRRR